MTFVSLLIHTFALDDIHRVERARRARNIMRERENRIRYDPEEKRDVEKYQSKTAGAKSLEASESSGGQCPVGFTKSNLILRL